MSSIKKITHRARRVMFRPPGADRDVIAELTPQRLTFKGYRRHKGSGPSLNLVDLHNIAQRFHKGELWSGGELAECMGDGSKLAAVKKAYEGYSLKWNAARTMAGRAAANAALALKIGEILTEDNGGNGA